MKLNKLFFKRILPIGAGVAVLGGLVYTLMFPAIVAVACPACFGMERRSAHIIVEQGMSPQQRAIFDHAVQSAQATVRSFYGAPARRPYVVVCATRACDARLKGEGVNALTLTAPWFTVVRVSSNGREAGFLAHELAHVDFHARIGLANLQRAVPAWFDEGLAAVIAGDARYVRGGAGAKARCKGNGAARLPSDAGEWTQRAMQNPAIYADAACRVIDWMDRHGGREAVLSLIPALAAGGLMPE